MKRDYGEEYLAKLVGRKVTEEYERSSTLRRGITDEEELQLLYALKKEMKNN